MTSTISFSKHALKNGLRIILAPRPTSVSVAVAIYVGVGSRYETKKQSGLSHFLEHMAFKGTKKYPNKMAIARKVEGMGGYNQAGTGTEDTEYYIGIGSKYFSEALDILDETVFHSLFRSTDIEMEKGVILEEIKMIQDDPKDWVTVLIDKLMWPKSPLGRFGAGTPETVKALRRQDFVDYIKSTYSPQNIIVGVAGNFDEQKVLTEIETRFKPFSISKPKDFEKVKEEQSKPQLLLETRKTEQTNFCLNFRAYPYKHPDRFNMGMMTAILGAGMSSRLFKAIREDRGLAYALSAAAYHHHDTGVVQIHEGVDNNRVDEAITVTLREIKKLKEKKVGGEELRKIKEYAKGILALRLESNSALINWFAGQEMFLDEILNYEEYCQRVDAVTAEDIKRVANDLFTNERLNLALIGPFEDEGRFRKLLNVM